VPTAIRPAILSRKTTTGETATTSTATAVTLKTNRVLSELANYASTDEKYPAPGDRKVVSFSSNIPPIHPHALIASPNSFGIASMLTDMANFRATDPSSSSNASKETSEDVNKISSSSSEQQERQAAGIAAVLVVNKENRAEMVSIGNSVV